MIETIFIIIGSIIMIGNIVKYTLDDESERKYFQKCLIRRRTTMKLSSNFIKFHDELGLKKTIDVFSEAVFEGIDFNADLEEYYTDAHDLDFYKEIRAYAKDRGIVFEQTHAPFGSSFLDEEKSKQRFEEIVKSIEHSSWLGADMIVIHPCSHIIYKDGNNRELMMEYNYYFYKKLISYAECFEIKIAIENIPNSITENPEGLIELIKSLDNDVFTVCYDVGHANVVGQDPAGMIKKLGNYIGCTHIHDNDGTRDAHTLPYYGSIDWEKVMEAFAKIGYSGNLNYEAGLFVKNAPIDLRPESAKYMADVGKHLIERFNYYKSNK